MTNNNPSLQFVTLVRAVVREEMNQLFSQISLDEDTTFSMPTTLSASSTDVKTYKKRNRGAVTSPKDGRLKKNRAAHA